MNCRMVEKRLVAYQDQELHHAESRAVEEHLTECEACLERHYRLLAATPLAPDVVLASHVRHRTHLDLDRALKEAAETAPARSAVFRPLTELLSQRTSIPVFALFPVAATIALAMLWATMSPGSPSPEGSLFVESEMESTQSSAVLPANAYVPAAYTPEDSWF